MVEKMTTPTPIQTSHTPRPSLINRGRCAICNSRIRYSGNSYVHLAESSMFNAERQKKLYERLDVVATLMEDPSLGMPDLLEALSAISEWRRSPELWKLLERWRRDHDEEARDGT
jgi:hypothetical protein